MERLIDMEDRHLCLLRKLLNDHLANKTVWAYGSRAKWNAKQSSDLDLVVWDASTAQITEAIDAFSESNLPFTVQLFAWENTPKDFQEDIQKKYVVLQEGSKIPEGWREAKLGDVAEIIGGGTPSTKEPKYWDGNIPWLTPRDLSNFGGRYITKGERSISELGLHNSNAKLLPKGAVLLTTRAPIGYLAIARNEVTINQGFKGLIASEHTNNLFLYYLLKHNIDYLKAHSSGTTFGELSGITLKSISFCIPPLPEQKAIAEVLSSLEDKIDLLHRQNKTLENMAQTLFQKWFIEDAKSDWKEGVVGELVEIEKGEKIGKGEKEYLEIGDINMQTKDYNIKNKEKLTVAGSVRVPKGTLLISTVRPTRGAVTMTKSNINVSSAFMKIKLGLSIILCNFIFNIKSALIFYRKSVHRRYPIS